MALECKPQLLAQHSLSAARLLGNGRKPERSAAFCSLSSFQSRLHTNEKMRYGDSELALGCAKQEPQCKIGTIIMEGKLL